MKPMHYVGSTECLTGDVLGFFVAVDCDSNRIKSENDCWDGSGVFTLVSATGGTRIDCRQIKSPSLQDQGMDTLMPPALKAF